VSSGVRRCPKRCFAGGWKKGKKKREGGERTLNFLHSLKVHPLHAPQKWEKRFKVTNCLRRTSSEKKKGRGGGTLLPLRNAPAPSGVEKKRRGHCPRLFHRSLRKGKREKRKKFLNPKGGRFGKRTKGREK